MTKGRYLDENCSVCGGEIALGDGWDHGGDVAHDVCLQDIGYGDQWLPPTDEDRKRTLECIRILDLRN